MLTQAGTHVNDPHSIKHMLRSFEAVNKARGSKSEQELSKSLPLFEFETTWLTLTGMGEVPQIITSPVPVYTPRTCWPLQVLVTAPLPSEEQ